MAPLRGASPMQAVLSPHEHAACSDLLRRHGEDALDARLKLLAWAANRLRAAGFDDDAIQEALGGALHDARWTLAPDSEAWYQASRAILREMLRHDPGDRGVPRDQREER